MAKLRRKSKDFFHSRKVKKMMNNLGNCLLKRLSLGVSVQVDFRERANVAKKNQQSLETTVKTLLWTHRKLSIYVVEDKAINFILDTDFMHFVSLAKSVQFIRQIFNELKGTDWFGLSSLGDQKLSIRLEPKSYNLPVKRRVLSNLAKSIEEVMTLERQVLFKVALNDSVKQLMSLVPERILTHEHRHFESPKKWVICFLGSLRGIRNFDGTSYDPFVNIIIVCITDEQIDDE